MPRYTDKKVNSLLIGQHEQLCLVVLKQSDFGRGRKCHNEYCTLYDAHACGAYLLCTAERRQDKFRVMAILIRKNINKKETL